MNTVLRINGETDATLVEGFGQEAINSVRKYHQKTGKRKTFVKIVLLGFIDDKDKFIPYKNN